jgi:putative transposase
MSSYGCQQILISPDAQLKAILEFACQESNKLANCAIYYCRQLYFKTGQIAHRYDLNKLLKTNPHFQALYSHVGQATLTAVAESFQSFKALRTMSLAGELDQKPRLPNYRTKDGFNLISFPAADVKFKPNGLRFPLGGKVKAWFGINAFYLPMPSNLDYKSIREYRILPRNGCFYLELVYKVEQVQTDVDSSRVLGVDHGISNWLTCVSNAGTSFIVDGRHLKSLNQFYNKQIANIKEGKPQGFWSKKLANITEKRNRQVRDAVNKAARLVINHCLEKKIGTIIFGWNIGQKDSANMGAKTNQKFVQIPTGRLKDRIAQLAEQYGIKFVETEESYTSKASFVDLDVLPKIGEKPDGWQESGKRVKRGLYRTANNQYINADCNGAANIIRKVAATLGLCLKGVSSGALITPLRVRIWAAQESPALANQSASRLIS